jgi:CRP-like cAMP-binding protein
MTTSNEPAMRDPQAERFHDVKVAYLSETDLFQDLAARDLDELERSTAMSSCNRGRVFFTPGETGEVLFVLKSGRVNLYRMTSEGKKLVIATIEPGTVFGEMSLIGQGMFDSFAEAAEDCTLCVMSRLDVERLLREHPAVSVRLLELLARRLQETQERLADVAYKSVPARIAATLLRLSGEGEAPVRLSHQDIAEMVGTYRETATRILNELRADELIELKRMQIVVRDAEGLDAVAQELT